MIRAVDGGNTFYLLEKTYESGFDAAVRAYLGDDRGLYVGVSAGTLLAGPDIAVAEPFDDKSKANITSTKALGLIDTVYSPHYKDEEKEVIERYRKETTFPIEALRDGQAVFVNGEDTKIIGILEK